MGNKTIQQSADTIRTQVQTLLEQMTLAEKIGQMAQVEIYSIPVEDITTHFIGSVLSGGGGNPDQNDVKTWRDMVQACMRASLETRLGIPLIYGVDGVHGHNNVVGATIFPHNINLGATHDTDLVERIAQATAREILATNVHWDFAPAVSVPQDVRWGRTYEGFSENTDVVCESGAAYVRGLQQAQPEGDWVLASVKHFVGDGGTGWGTRTGESNAEENWQAAGEDWYIDQGDTQVDEETLRRIHLAPYIDAIAAGAENIMVSFSSWNGLKMHAHEYLLTQVLKVELGFEGFLISDWMALSQIADTSYEAVVAAINAGLDMIMVPYDYKTFISDLTRAVESGDVSLERVDDAVRRILYSKFSLGLFDSPMTADSYVADLGCEAHRAIAREAVQKSAVLLKHENAVLPLQPVQTVAVVGQAADDIGYACGGWTIEWQGSPGRITEGSTLLDGVKALAGENVVYSADGSLTEKVDTAVVVIAEKPYAEGEGDSDDLRLSAEQRELIAKARVKCDCLVLVIYSGRSLILTDVLDQCDAIVAAWLPGSEANAIADVLYGTVPFTGKSPYTWYASMGQMPLSKLQASGETPLYPFEHGLTL